MLEEIMNSSRREFKAPMVVTIATFENGEEELLGEEKALEET